MLCHDLLRGQRCSGIAGPRISNVAVSQWLCTAMSRRVGVVVPVVVCDMQHHRCDVSCCGRRGAGMPAGSAGFLSLMFLYSCTGITLGSLF